jgi:hypothetical protein
MHGRYPRNEQARRDALLGPGHVSDHAPRNEQSRRDAMARDGYPACTVEVTGTGAACTEAEIVTGGQTLIFTITGNDEWMPDVAARLAALLATVLPATDTISTVLTGASWVVSAANKVLTVTFSAHAAYSVTAGEKNYDCTLDKELFRYRNATLVKTAACVVTGA